ncbi:response regulator [candidate division KSB1 bacterium]|nr:response regulator [candidate division KSB1 bacterium]
MLHGVKRDQVKMMCGRNEKVEWTILVASKDELIHKFVAQVVNNKESRIIAAISVKAFFEKLIEEEVDLIIYDPDLDPIDTMGAFSIAKTYHPDIPSILIYGNEDYEVTKSILDKGVIFRMLKPINKDDLQQIYDGFRHSKTRHDCG